jgi:MFS transporter, DHA2 family, methylenomycin A resistance protein
MTTSAAPNRSATPAIDGFNPRGSVTGAPAAERHARLALTAAMPGFFVLTLDAVAMNVTLPSIRIDLGGGITGLQSVVELSTCLPNHVPALQRRCSPNSP